MKSNDPHLNQALAKALENYVFKDAETKLDKALGVIMESNHASEGTMRFLYKGVAYAPPKYLDRNRLKLLPKRLHEHMDHWLQEQKEVFEEKVAAHTFFSILLTQSHTSSDLYALLPECLRPALVLKHDSPTRFSPEEVQAFHTQNEQTILKIKTRLVLNMIT